MGARGFTVPYPSRVQLGVYDLQGRRVSLVADGVYPPGRHRVSWSSRSGGTAVPAGIYFVRYQTPAGDIVRRLVTN